MKTNLILLQLLRHGLTKMMQAYIVCQAIGSTQATWKPRGGGVGLYVDEQLQDGETTKHLKGKS